MKKVFTLLVLSVFSITAYAQDRIDAEQPTLSKPISKLNKTKGWRYNEHAGKWGEGFKNSISLIDDFNDFSFYVVEYNGKKYLDLIKTEDVSGYKYPKIKAGPYRYSRQIDFITDLDDYKRQIQELEDNGEISLPLKYFNEHGRISDLIFKEDTTQQYALKIKYRFDDAKKIARFLVYVIDTQSTHSHFKLKGLNKLDAIESRDIFKVIQNEDVFTKFYYECKLDDFLKFIKAPLNL